MARTKEFDESEILEKAIELFWSKGYNTTSAQDLVDKLGISRSSLYDTWSDKRTLFIKALQAYRESNLASLQNLVKEAGDPEKAVRAILHMAIQENIESKNRKGCLMVNTTVEMGLQDKEILALAREHMQAMEDFFYSIIKKGQEAGQFSTRHSARSMARFLYNNISGIGVAGKYHMDKKVMEDVVKVILSSMTS